MRREVSHSIANVIPLVQYYDSIKYRRQIKDAALKIIGDQNKTKPLKLNKIIKKILIFITIH